MRQRRGRVHNDGCRPPDQSRDIFPIVFGFACNKAIINPHILAVGPAQLLQSLLECREAYLVVLIVGHAREHADAPHPLGLLRARRHRPHRHRPSNQPDELAASHSITSSARASSGSGTAMPSALAVLMLMISSALVPCCTGRSEGFSPLRMRPV